MKSFYLLLFLFSSLSLFAAEVHFFKNGKEISVESDILDKDDKIVIKVPALNSTGKPALFKVFHRGGRSSEFLRYPDEFTIVVNSKNVSSGSVNLFIVTKIDDGMNSSEGIDYDSKDSFSFNVRDPLKEAARIAADTLTGNLDTNPKVETDLSVSDSLESKSWSWWNPFTWFDSDSEASKK